MFDILFLVDPGQPTLALSSAVDVSRIFEYEVVEFVCQSSGGNPAPNITWYRNGQLLNAATRLILPITKYGTTTSVLARNLTADDNMANFSCLARSDIIRPFEISSAVTRFSVKCKLVHIIYDEISLPSFSRYNVECPKM